MATSKCIGAVLFALIAVIAVEAPISAAIPTCNIHNGMKIWFLDYANDDYTLAHPLGVLEGTVDINDRSWHAKCAKDGPRTKIYVPVNYTTNGKSLWDTRWAQAVYKTKAEAQAAYQSHH